MENDEICCYLPKDVITLDIRMRTYKNEQIKFIQIGVTVGMDDSHYDVCDVQCIWSYFSDFVTMRNTCIFDSC